MDIIKYFTLSNFFILIILISLIILLFHIADNNIYEHKIDNKLFFDTKKFEIFDEITQNWEIIQQEAKYVLENAPQLDITRTYEDWNNSDEYMNKIIDKYGWIRGWNKPNENTQENGQGNYKWLNYGLLYNSTEFSKNVVKCSKTLKLLEKIKDKINIAGFSYMKGNGMITKHTDSTGIKYNSLAFHLGLIVPKPYSTCQMIINDGYKNYYYTETPGKTAIFDGTYEHYAYNKSSEDRVILYIDFKV